MSKARLLLKILTVVTFLFIWGNSALPGTASNAISDWVRSLLPHLGSGGGEVSSWLVRKAAHFSEYAVLGALLTLESLVGKRVTRPPADRLALCGVFTALIDETIQLFNGRTSSVRDVWIDFGGFVFGLLIAWAVTVTARRHKSGRGGIHVPE